MATYTVTKTYKYTVAVTVEAESKRAAEEMAMETDGDRNEDDSLYDCVAREVSDEGK